MTGILRDLSISRDGQQFAVAQLEASQNLTRLPLTPDGSSPTGPEEVLSRGQIIDRMPQVSPDGRSIAYTSDRLGLDDLWIARLEPTHLERIQFPGPDQGVSGPHWFPDGRHLYVIRLFSAGKLSLWSVAADGSQAEELITPEALLQSEGFPVSPDGHIVYSARTGQHYQLFSFDVKTRQARQLTFSPDDKVTACFSPDGRWLAYSSDASGDLQLWRMPSAGGEAHRLTTGTKRIRHMFYSSDGRWLYFQPNHLNIYRMPADGGPVTQVTHFPEPGLFIEEPTISPNNRYLAYCRVGGGSSLWLLKIGPPPKRD
jgi:Tol biopolymer transport system component